MKGSRILIVVLALALMLLPLPTSAAGSYGTPDDDCFTYTIANGSATITSYTGSAVNVAVPTSIKGTPVTAIADGVFASHSELLRVYLPEGLQSIGARAFEGCTSLLTLTLPQGLVSLGEGALRGCTALYLVDIHDGLKTIGASAFSGCSSLSGITLPASLESIGEGAFADCAALCSIVLCGTSPLSLPAGLTSGSPNAVVYSAAGGAGTVKAATPSAGATISYRNIAGGLEITACATSAEALVLPETIGGVRVTAIGEGAFKRDCASLRTIVLPRSVTSLESEAFFGLSRLTYIRMPDQLRSNLGTGCFEGCSSLRALCVPGGVTAISMRALYGCAALETVSLPSTVTRILSGAFSGCTSLSRLYMAGDEPECQGKNGTSESQAFGGVPTGMMIYTQPGRTWSTSSALWYPNGRSSGGYARTALAGGCFYVETSYREATCHTEGARVFTCHFCGSSFSESMPKTEHKYVSVGNADGYETFRCLNCTSNYTLRRIEVCELTPVIDLGKSGTELIRSLDVTFYGTPLTYGVDYSYEVVHVSKYSRLEVTVTGIGSYRGSVTYGFSAYTGEPLKRYTVVTTGDSAIDGLGEYYRDDRVTLAPADAVPDGYEVTWVLDGVSSSVTSGDTVSFSMPAHTVSVYYLLSKKPEVTTTEPPVTTTDAPITEPPVTTPDEPVTSTTPSETTTDVPTSPQDTTTREPYSHTQQGERYLRTAMLWAVVLFGSLAAFVGLCIAVFKKK